MQAILDRGISLILWLQQCSPGLDWPFKFFTILGGSGFLLGIMPVIYWSIDCRQGRRLFVLLLLSAYINSAAKVLVHQPRPFEYDPQVQPLVNASGGGLPSGHTQNAVVFWGYLMHW
ncbi:MAG: phosphatase PAP2 family protein [Desulfobacterales bacterium]|nr:MAG: phosphatase PAP2 family protein [Desulfobacterales bacterium]